MKEIIFLAPFPNPGNIKEGMIQRVNAVDKMFISDEYNKTYIIPRFKIFNTTSKKVDHNIIEINLSIWTSFFTFIKSINKADVVYAHSLYGISLAAFFIFPFFKNKNFIWDVHGIVPEEIKFAGYGRLKYLIYSALEKIVIKKANKIIVVTKAMQKHLNSKYSNVKADFLIYPILPNTINLENGIEEHNGKINIVYSGNTQGYQNIPLMVESIKGIIDYPSIYIYILTGQKKEMIAIFNKSGLLSKENIFIDSVDPNELNNYYRKAYYGFILRDNVPVNNVACPTKIIEYLAYGMTCITLNSEIGDFQELGFDYISLDNLKYENLNAVKSLKNSQIYSDLYQQNKPLKITSFILK